MLYYLYLVEGLRIDWMGDDVGKGYGGDWLGIDFELD